MGVDHIGSGALNQELQRLWRELRRVAKATLQNASIGRGGLRVYDGGWIRIEGGGLAVTGTQTVSGRLEGSGTFDWTGPMNLRGEQSVTGPTTFTGQLTVNGPWDLNGNGDITGNVGLTGNMTVGSMVIDPASGGSVTFPGGAMVQADPGGGVRMVQGSNRVYVGGGLVSMQMGTRSISISASGIQMSGLDVITSSLANGAPSGCIWTDGTGEVFEVVAG